MKSIIALCGVVVLNFVACASDEGPLMDPGQDCQACHTAGGNAPEWKSSGTLFSDAKAAETAGLSGAKVVYTDAAGKVVTLTTNAAGNFYTRESFTFPVSIALQNAGQQKTLKDHLSVADKASCNSCHTLSAGRAFIK